MREGEGTQGTTSLPPPEGGVIAQPLFELQGVSFSFDSGRTPVAKAISLLNITIPANCIVSIIGPNGAGKSTLLKLLLGYLMPQEGRIISSPCRIGPDPRSLGIKPPKSDIPKIAFLPAQTDSLPDIRVGEFVDLGRTPFLDRTLSLQSEPDTEGSRVSVSHLLDRLSLVQLSSKQMGQISSGERQRALIAQTLVQNAPVILLDEPLSYIDLRHQNDIWNLFIEEREKRKSLILAIHDLNMASRYSDWVILLADGGLISSGSPSDVVSRENLSAAYGSDCIVTLNPLYKRPEVIILGEPLQPMLDYPYRFHVIGGGGMAAPILLHLARLGIPFTAGVLNEGDSDERVAALGAREIVLEPPFSKIGTEAKERLKRLLRESDTIVISNVPVGEGNLPNIEAVYEVMKEALPEEKKRVILICDSPFESRDFTDGRFLSTAAELSRMGASAVTTEEFLQGIANHEWSR